MRAAVLCVMIGLTLFATRPVDATPNETITAIAFLGFALAVVIAALWRWDNQQWDQRQQPADRFTAARNLTNTHKRNQP